MQDSDYIASANAATQDSNQWHDCHARQPQQPGLAQRLPKTDGAKGIANIRSGGLLPRKHSPAHIRLSGPATHLSTSEGWKDELA